MQPTPTWALDFAGMEVKVVVDKVGHDFKCSECSVPVKLGDTQFSMRKQTVAWLLWGSAGGI